MTILEKKEQMEQMERNIKQIRNKWIVITTVLSLIMVIDYISFIIYLKSNYSKFRFYSTDLALVLLAGISLHVVAIFTLWTNYKEKEKQKRNYIKGVQRKLEIANTYNLRTDEFVEVICSEHTNTMECYAKLILKDKLEEIAVVRKSGQIQLEQMVDNFSCFQVTYKPKN